MSGFYSKDAILESFYNVDASLFWLLCFLFGVGLTAAYSIKITLLAVVDTGSGSVSDLMGGGLT